MNMFKKNGGFTLVELIVVIAILAILAAVAVPAYSGYISQANKSSDDAAIVVLNQAIGATCAMKGKLPADVTVTFDADNVTIKDITCGTESYMTTFNEMYAGNKNPLKLSFYKELTCANGVVSGVEK